jgi:hypothetical protein
MTAASGASPAWVRVGSQATLALTAQRASTGRLAFDAATGDLVFEAGSIRARTPAAGQTTVVLSGVGGATSFTVDLRGLLATAALQMRLEGAVGSLGLLGPPSDARLSGDAVAGWLAFDALASRLSFQAPLLALGVDAGSGSVAVAAGRPVATGGADLSVTGHSVTVERGASIDTRGETRTGDLTLAAVASGPRAAASLLVSGATLTAHAITLSATATSTGTGAGPLSSSAAVDLDDATVDASGDLRLTGASRLTHTVSGASASSSAASTATTMVGGTSALTARGGLFLVARNTTDVGVAATSGTGPALADAVLARTTRAAITGQVEVRAASVNLSALASGSMSITADGRRGASPAQRSGPAALAYAISPLAGAVAAGRVTTDTAASVGGSLTLVTPAPLSLTAGSSLTSAVSARSPDDAVAALAVTDTATGSLSSSAVVRGVSDLTVSADSSDGATVDGGSGLGVLSSTVTT